MILIPFLCLLAQIAPLSGAKTALTHPFHATVCELHYQAKDSTLEVSVKLFADDMNTMLQKKTGETLMFATERESPSANRYFLDYFYQHFYINLDNRAHALAFMGKETDQKDPAIVWAYFYIEHVKPPQTVYLHNSLLCDYFADQTNIAHVKVGDTEKNLLLSPKNPGGELSFP